MQLVQVVLFAFGTGALVRAWPVTRGTAMFHALHWGFAAWLAWAIVICLRLPQLNLKMIASHPEPGIYLALCLTGCAGVAVLGARRPHVAADRKSVV